MPRYRRVVSTLATSSILDMEMQVKGSEGFRKPEVTVEQGAHLSFKGADESVEETRENLTKDSCTHKGTSTTEQLIKMRSESRGSDSILGHSTSDQQECQNCLENCLTSPNNINTSCSDSPICVEPNSRICEDNSATISTEWERKSHLFEKMTVRNESNEKLLLKYDSSENLRELPNEDLLDFRGEELDLSSLQDFRSADAGRQKSFEERSSSNKYILPSDDSCKARNETQSINVAGSEDPSLTPEKLKQPRCSELIDSTNEKPPFSGLPTKASLPSPTFLDKSDGSQLDAALTFFTPTESVLPLSTSRAINKVIMSLVDSGIDHRHDANVQVTEKEDPQKKTVYIIYNSICTPVTWFSETTAQDVREMILCACDSIINSGFVLSEVLEVPECVIRKTRDRILETTINGEKLFYKRGRRFEFEEFHETISGGVYTLIPASERSDLLKITGDKWRRLKLRIDPLLHVEAIRAVEIMKKGSNLLIHSEFRYPFLRQFQLSQDSKRLLWYSLNPAKESTFLTIQSIRSINIGQDSPCFKVYEAPSLKHLSFSVTYESEGGNSFHETLQKIVPMGRRNLTCIGITCKNEKEFDTWVCGLRALVFSQQNMLLSKEELLFHSRLFMKAIEDNNPGVTLSDLPVLGDLKTMDLEDFVELPKTSLADTEQKIKRLNGLLCNRKQGIREYERLYRKEQGAEGEDATGLIGEENDPVGPGPGELASHAQTESVNQSRPENIKYSPDMSFYRNKELGARKPFLDSYTEEDDRLEYKRAKQLVEDVEKRLMSANLLLESHCVAGTSTSKEEKKEANSLVAINKLLWMAEVDIENIGDMINRLSGRRRRKNRGIRETIGVFLNEGLTETLSKQVKEIEKVTAQISTSLVSLFNSTQSSISNLSSSSLQHKDS